MNYKKFNAWEITNEQWDALLEEHGDLSYCTPCGRIFHMDSLSAYTTTDNGEVLCSKCAKKRSKK